MAGQVLRPEVHDLEQHRQDGRGENAPALASPVEIPGQQARQRDHREHQGVDRRDQPQMYFGRQVAGGAGSEQLVEIKLLRLARARGGGVPAAGELHGVALEGQHGELTGLQLVLLPAAVHHQHARSIGPVDQGAALRKQGHGLLGVAHIVNEDSAKLAAAVATADIDREAVGDGIEHAFLDEGGGEAAADLELQVLELAKGRRQQICRKREKRQHAAAGENQRGSRERHLAQP